MFSSEGGRGWSLSLYAGAGEAGGSWQSGSSSGGARPGPGEAADPDRSASEAARRARGQLRRYCTANRLNRFGTLTYEGEGVHDPRLLRVHVGEFFRSLRASLGGKAFPYVWVPEWHHTDHGLHVHFAVGRYIARRHLLQAWGRGHVHIKLIGDLPVGSGVHAEARRAAGYLSKYVGKGFDEVTEPGLHRYEGAQGFQPERTRLWGRMLDDVVAQAVDVMGSAPGYVWQSQVADGWMGPPAVWLSWN